MRATFGNGQYEKYAQNVARPNYMSSAFVDSVSLTTTNETFLSITFHNTGTIPLTSANVTIGDCEMQLPLNADLQPGESAVFDNLTISETYRLSQSYPIMHEFSFARQEYIHSNQLGCVYGKHLGR